MKAKEAKELAKIILGVSRLRALLVELDKKRDRVAFEDEKRKSVEKTIKAAEKALRKSASMLRTYGIGLI